MNVKFHLLSAVRLKWQLNELSFKSDCPAAFESKYFSGLFRDDLSFWRFRTTSWTRSLSYDAKCSYIVIIEITYRPFIKCRFIFIATFGTNWVQFLWNVFSRLLSVCMRVGWCRMRVCSHQDRIENLQTPRPTITVQPLTASNIFLKSPTRHKYKQKYMIIFGGLGSRTPLPAALCSLNVPRWEIQHWLPHNIPSVLLISLQPSIDEIVIGIVNRLRACYDVTLSLK